MVQKMTVQLADDLDGTVSDDVNTVSFGLDGVEYKIDLTEANAHNLRNVLEDYVVHGRRIGGRRKRSAPKTRSSAAATSHEQAQAIREWARRNGHEVPDRGRIAGNIIEAFTAAQVDANATTRSQKAKASATT